MKRVKNKIFSIKLVLSIICNKCDGNDEKIFY